MEDLGMKKVILILALVALLVTVAGTAQAAKKFFPATITYAGAWTHVADTMVFQAESTTGAWTGAVWYLVASSDYKTQLAVALTAYSMGAPVLLYMEETDLDAWSPCYGIFVAPQQ
jgi:hypothetical protein